MTRRLCKCILSFLATITTIFRFWFKEPRKGSYRCPTLQTTSNVALLFAVAKTSFVDTTKRYLYDEHRSVKRAAVDADERDAFLDWNAATTVTFFKHFRPKNTFLQVCATTCCLVFFTFFWRQWTGGRVKPHKTCSRTTLLLQQNNSIFKVFQNFKNVKFFG